jgi:Fic family protein
VIVTAGQAIATARAILQLFARDRALIEPIGRAAATALRLHQLLQRRALVTIPAASRQLGLSQPTVTAAIEQLMRLGIVHETTGRRRGRVFVYGAYMNLLSEGTEPLRD